MFDRETEIETKRMILRAVKEDDGPKLLEIFSDKEMFKYTPDEPWKSIEDARGFINLVSWLYDNEGSNFKHFFTVANNQSGKIIGICGIGGIEYDRNQNEVFYHIAREHWGKGYASEAAEAILEYGFMRKGLDKVIGIFHVDNAASNRVMVKMGMKLVGTLSDLPAEFDHIKGENLYTLSREDYFKLQNKG